jgi:hypothetical protein
MRKAAAKSNQQLNLPRTPEDSRKNGRLTALVAGAMMPKMAEPIARKGAKNKEKGENQRNDQGKNSAGYCDVGIFDKKIGGQKPADNQRKYGGQ